MKARHAFDRKFILAAFAIVVGAAMVFLEYLDGAVWAGMTGGIITGFFAVTGWATNREEVRRELEVQAKEKGHGTG